MEEGRQQYPRSRAAELAVGTLSIRHAAVSVGGTFVVSPFTYVGS